MNKEIAEWVEAGSKPRKHKAPGRADRTGISLPELFAMFPDDETAEAWFISQRWPDGMRCPDCQSADIQERPTRKPQPYRCRSCRKDFSAKTGTLMHASKLGYRIWALAIYLMSTNLKGVSSMKLHRDLGVTQKTAWHLAHRIRESWTDGQPDPFTGPVEVDETFIGGKEGNKHASKKLRAGRGAVGKEVVAGVKDRATGKVVARHVADTSGPTLIGFVADNVGLGAQVFTDEHRGYLPLSYSGFEHQSVAHTVGQWVDGQAHTNGVESFWSMLKRGYHGTYHQMSAKHLGRYVNEFAGRHNQRPLNTEDQMGRMAASLDGKRLPYAVLTYNPPEQ